MACARAHAKLVSLQPVAVERQMLRSFLSSANHSIFAINFGKPQGIRFEATLTVRHQIRTISHWMWFAEMISMTWRLLDPIDGPTQNMLK